ncbi:hypothetical protein DPMN_178891 [Dreissena polymorpha]|uniref:Uncharacterized protein n=1 Tax=Dreissena polymorpha TaxID=45954 RepID=A0A9D4EF36_DREPO|nr:hypothetical protein DPMN_178891 [Dreissena polymorpha]
MSFTCIKNRRGPRSYPCGTPQEIPAVDKKVPETSTSCCLSERYDLNHLKISSPRPAALSFIRRVEWSTVSKAF